MTGQLLQFLESLRAPVAAMAGLPVESVIVYLQQDLMMHIASAISKHQCAVLLGISGMDIGGKADQRVPGPPVDAALEVAVWTPEVVLSAGNPLVMDVAESIVSGLHGRKPPEGAAGGALIPAFRNMNLSAVGGEGRPRTLVATLTFTVPVYLRARRLTAAD
ncbi:MAG: hypothetical protein JWM59_1543 [Verrucomicrobiales bacterium]|nr:hypothetical protein [Verrucomicrobiales bacterium]